MLDIKLILMAVYHLFISMFPDGHQYEIEITFFADVKPETSTWVLQPRYIEMKIYKQKSQFWDRLISQAGKRPHWLTVDWSKWKDDDETDDEVNFSGGQHQAFNDFNFNEAGDDGDDDISDQENNL